MHYNIIFWSMSIPDGKLKIDWPQGNQHNDVTKMSTRWFLFSQIYLIQISFHPRLRFQCGYFSYRNHTSWIGFTDEVSEGNWTWIDPTTPSDYTNWRPKGGQWFQEPNGGKSENCATIGGPYIWKPVWNWEGYWNDWKCSEKAPFICRRKIAGA